MSTKGGFEMETIVIAGAVWFSLLFIFIWLNYRFHRFLKAKTASLSARVPLQREVMASGVGN
jgi:hypothetical protein